MTWAVQNLEWQKLLVCKFWLIEVGKEGRRVTSAEKELFD